MRMTSDEPILSDLRELPRPSELAGTAEEHRRADTLDTFVGGQAHGDDRAWELPRLISEVSLSLALRGDAIIDSARPAPPHVANASCISEHPDPIEALYTREHLIEGFAEQCGHMMPARSMTWALLGVPLDQIHTWWTMPGFPSLADVLHVVHVGEMTGATIQPHVWYDMLEAGLELGALQPDNDRYFGHHVRPRNTLPSHTHVERMAMAISLTRHEGLCESDVVHTDLAWLVMDGWSPSDAVALMKARVGHARAAELSRAGLGSTELIARVASGSVALEWALGLQHARDNKQTRSR